MDLVQEHEIPLPPAISEGDVISLFEARCRELGLAHKRLDLKKYPGASHWHLTKDGEKGTLEATFWPAKNRLWLSVHANRTSPWQDTMRIQLLNAFHAEVAGEAEDSDGEGTS